MSQGVVSSNLTGGKYKVKAILDNTKGAEYYSDVQREISATEGVLSLKQAEYANEVLKYNELAALINVSDTIEAQQKAIADARIQQNVMLQVSMQVNILQTKLTQLYIKVRQMIPEPGDFYEVDAYSADGTDDISVGTEVGIIDRDRENYDGHSFVTIKPSYDGGTNQLHEYIAASDGNFTHHQSIGSANYAYSYAMVEAADKWKPVFGYAQVTAINGSVATLDNGLSGEIVYLDCNESAFVVGDNVVFKVVNNVTTVNGFQKDAKECIYCPEYDAIITLHAIDNPNAWGTVQADGFGSKVDIHGNYAIVGTPLEENYNEIDGFTYQSGVVYIFNVTTGGLIRTRMDPNAYGTPTSDYFGWAVAISDNYYVVGALEDDGGGNDSGKIYIFDTTSGVLLHTIDNPNALGTSAWDSFGSKVGICSDYCIATAYGDGTYGDYSGTAYIFRNSTGALLHTLLNPNVDGSAADDLFGFDVGMSESFSIVAAPDEESDGGVYQYQGKAYIYNNATGELIHTLSSPFYGDSDAYARFAMSVDISEKFSIVGIPRKDSYSGKACIYNNTSGELVHTLENPNILGSSAGDQFGDYVAINDCFCAVIATQEEDINSNETSRVYVFSNITGNLLRSISTPLIDITDRAFSISMSETHIIVGYPNSYDSDPPTTAGSYSGKTYIYEIQTL